MGKECTAFRIADAMEAKRHMALNVVQDYGASAYGHSLHCWDDGGRYLARCCTCGGYVLVQRSEFHGAQDDDDYVDFFPVGGAEEADELNRLYDGFAIERHFPKRYLMMNNLRLHWAGAPAEQPPASDCAYPIRGRLFHEDDLFAQMQALARAENLTATEQALGYMRERHAGQLRAPGKFSSEKVAYINHPLTMACQAHALGIRDDRLLAALLLHDVVEDTGVPVQELPFDREVRQLVELVSFSVPAGLTKAQAKALYYEKIRQNGKACVIKVLDRCNNLSTMAASFDKARMARYVAETEEYILPLFEVLKSEYPQYGDLVFLVKYHLLSVLETVKCLSAAGG